MTRLVQLLDSLNERIGSWVSWLTLLMMLTTCMVVAARYVFNIGSIALQESTMYLHGLVFMLGISYTLKHQAHVRVDVFYEKFSPKMKAIIDLLGTVIFLLPVATFILLSSINYVAFAWSLQESSAQPGGLAGIYLLKTLIPIMAVLLMLQGLAEIGRSILVLKRI